MASKDESNGFAELEFLKFRYNKRIKEISDLLSVLKIELENLPPEVGIKVSNCANILVRNGATSANQIEIIRTNVEHVLEQTGEIDFTLNLKLNITSLETIMLNLKNISNQLINSIDYFQKSGDLLLRIDESQDLPKENYSPNTNSIGRDDDNPNPHRNVLELKMKIENKKAVLKKLTMEYESFPQDLNLARAKLQEATIILRSLNDELGID